MEADTQSRWNFKRWQSVGRLFFRGLFSADQSGCRVCQGALIAGILLFWLHLSIVTWGWSALTLGSLFWGTLLTSLLATLISKTFSPALTASRFGKFLPLAGTGVVLAITGTTPFWWAGWDDFLALFLNFNGGILLASLLHGSLLAVVAECVLIDTPFHPSSETTGVRTPTPALFSAPFWLGTAAGVCLVALGLSTLVPVFALAVAGCLLLAGLRAWNVLQKETRAAIPQTEVSETVPVATPFAAPVATSFWTRCSLLAGMGTAGLQLPVLYRMMSQLQPETTVLFYGCGAALMLGMAWAFRRPSDSQPLWWRSILKVTAVWSVILLAFPLWISYYLWISATISSVTLAIVLRQVGMIAFFTPLGWGIGQIIRRSRETSVAAPFGFAAAFPTCFAVGFMLAGWSLPAWGVPIVLMSSLLGLLLTAWLCDSVAQNATIHETGSAAANSNHWMALFWTPTHRTRPLWLAAGLAAIGLPFVYQPELTARVLFSTHAFQAWREGTDLQKLPGITDGRLLAFRESSQGSLSYWKHQGGHVQLRQNGIPAGRISTQHELVPHPSGGLLGAVLPLSMHPAPREVLLVGLESGLNLQTALEFPIMNITCLEANEALIAEAKTGVLSPILASALNDDRVQIKTLNPNLAIRQSGPAYDVILETPGHSAAYAHAVEYDLAHYRQMEKRLAEGGIYCQRFLFTDYGPNVLLSLTQTLQQTFGYVTAFDTAPGEMLFVAARSAEDIFTADLMERVSSPQTRRCLARIGWDWSIAMNLARFELADLQGTKGFGLKTPWQGLGAFRLTTEMMRWGNKWGEVRQLLAAHPQRLLDHYAETHEKEMDDLLKRLSDVAAREQLLKQHPDQFWVYRKTLKTRLTDKPRTVIEPVKGEGLQQRRHPDDQRRLDYFEALGTASQKSPVTPADLAVVEEFARPFDPLVSYFIHAEIAKLYERCEPPQPDQELKHWLHALHFGGQQERSVRSVHRALQLLTQTDSTFTDAEQYDHINTLLELLKVRWQMRKSQQDISQQVLLLDLKDSLEWSQQGLTKMQELGQAAGISKQETDIRQQELERTLVRMLRSYRSELLAKASQLKYPLPATE